jgi:hypothetical protein
MRGDDRRVLTELICGFAQTSDGWRAVNFGRPRERSQEDTRYTLAGSYVYYFY